MKLDCSLHALRLFTPGNGSRKQNIFSSNYTHSSWIIHFGYVLFNVHDPIPIFGSLVVLAIPNGGTKVGCRDLCFFSWRFSSLDGSLCIRGQNKESFLPKDPTFLPWKLPVLGDVKKKKFIRRLHNSLQFKPRTQNLECLPVFCCFLHLCH